MHSILSFQSLTFLSFPLSVSHSYLPFFSLSNSSVTGSAIWCWCPWDGLGSGLQPGELKVGAWHGYCWFQNNLCCAAVTHFASDGHRDHSSMCLQLSVLLSKNCNLQRQAWRCTSLEQSKLKEWRRDSGAHTDKPISPPQGFDLGFCCCFVDQGAHWKYSDDSRDIDFCNTNMGNS